MIWFAGPTSPFYFKDTPVDHSQSRKRAVDLVLDMVLYYVTVYSLMIRNFQRQKDANVRVV